MLTFQYFFPFFCILFLYFVIIIIFLFLLFTIMATSLKSSWVRSSWNSMPGCFQSGFGPSPVQFWCDPVRSLHGTGLVALHSISPWACLAWCCKAWLYMYVQGLSIKRCTNKRQSLYPGVDSRTPASRFLWSWKMPVTPLLEIFSVEKFYSQPTYLQTLPVCLCWNVFKT